MRSLRYLHALACIGACGWTGCGELLVPREGFDETTPPAAPDYADDEVWAALPDGEDDADVAPSGETDRQAAAEIDVFFVHPTTYYSPATWNQPLDHRVTNELTDTAVLRNQASAFNAAARIFAPRYRQATLGAYTTDRREDGDAALALAYSDVRAAFEQYLASRSEGRPFFLAGHSQGSGHLLRLLSELFSDLAPDPSLRDRLIAAYVVGAAVPVDALETTIPGIPLCAAPEQTGCLVVWNSVDEGTRPARFDTVRVWTPSGVEARNAPALLCVSPVLWTADGSVNELADHLGAVKFERDDLSPDPSPGIARAFCNQDGLLEVSLTDSSYSVIGGDQHVYDYHLFYMDVRRNAVVRAEAYLR